MENDRGDETGDDDICIVDGDEVQRGEIRCDFLYKGVLLSAPLKCL